MVVLGFFDLKVLHELSLCLYSLWIELDPPLLPRISSSRFSLDVSCANLSVKRKVCLILCPSFCVFWISWASEHCQEPILQLWLWTCVQMYLVAVLLPTKPLTISPVRSWSDLLVKWPFQLPSQLTTRMFAIPTVPHSPAALLTDVLPTPLLIFT